MNHRVPSYLALKGDLYCSSGKSINPGCFFDAAVFRNLGKKQYEPRMTIGLSLRGFGFRVDAGWPIDFGTSFMQPRVYLGQDTVYKI